MTTSTREQIIAAADRLFYQNGFEFTSFSDIADAVKISRGNFYYHFKSKDEILDAVIAERLNNTRQMLKQWEIEGSEPLECIRSFIHIVIVNGKKIQQFGCPVGTLSAELAKLNHTAKGEANKLFSLFRTWLRRQFVLMGCKERADEHAMHLLVFSQGVASLENSIGDDKFVQREVRQICEWLEKIKLACSS